MTHAETCWLNMKLVNWTSTALITIRYFICIDLTILFLHNKTSTDSFHAKDVRQILSKGMCSIDGNLRVFSSFLLCYT